MKLQFLGQSVFSTNLAGLGINASDIAISLKDIQVFIAPFLTGNSLADSNSWVDSNSLATPNSPNAIEFSASFTVLKFI